MTQRKLAELIGCKSSFVSHIEHNSRNISLSYLRRIADALEMPAYRFISPDDDKICEGLGMLAELNEENLKAALEYIRYLNSKQK